MGLRDKFAKDADPKKIAKLSAKYGGSENDVWAVSPGNGFVRFDGNVVVIRQTALSRVVIGKGEKRIPVRQISAIQIKPSGPVVSGYIQFSLGGGNERRSQFGHQTWDALSDENSMPFTLIEQKQFERLRDAIEAALAVPVSTAAKAPASPSAGDALDQIRRLAELRAAGVLTEDEFQAKKTSLLGQI